MRIRRTISLAMLVVLVTLVTSTTASAQVVGGGLLLNGSFEGEFVALSAYPDTEIAPSWFPWWVGRRGGEAPWSNQRPQFSATDQRVRSGRSAQRLFTEFSTHQAGVLQQVNGVRRGDVLLFQVYARTWSSNLDHPCCSLQSGLVDLRVGIDPTGGTNPYAVTVVWSDAVRSDDTWSQLNVSATAAGNPVTVFVFSAPKYPVRHNEVYLDDARLVVVGKDEIPSAEIPNPEELENPLAVSEPFTLGDEVVSGPLVYSIQRGDTLSEIAGQFDVEVAELADANGLGEGDTIFVGGQLIIPGLTFVAPETVARYEVQEDDTLQTVASAFDTTVYMLAQLNGLVSYSVPVGTTLLVPIEPGSANDSDMDDTGALTSHVVQSNESLTRIGLAYDVEPQAIANLNRLGGGYVYPGQVLIIP